MSNTKHTPGPWKSNPYVHSMIHGFAVYSDKSCVDKIADDIKREADARLIAAAPEMLDELKLLQAWLEAKQKFNFAADNKIALDGINYLLAKVSGGAE